MLFPNPWFESKNSDGFMSQPNTIQMFVEAIKSLFTNN